MTRAAFLGGVEREALNVRDSTGSVAVLRQRNDFPGLV
jgi:hypothetical protein